MSEVPADHDRGDALQLGAGSGLRRAGRELRHRQQPGQRGAAARDDIDQRLDPSRIDSRQARCLFVTTVREDVAAVRRSAEEDGEDDGDDRHHEHRPRNPREARNAAEDVAAAEPIETACCRRAGSTGRAQG